MDIDDNEFAEFEKASDVQVGQADDVETNLPEDKEKPKKPSGRGPKEPKAKEPAPKPGADEIEVTKDGEDEDDDEEIEDEDKPKPKPKASDRIRELNKRLRQEERLRVAADERLERLEKNLLPNQNNRGNSSDIGNAPDPGDAAKYPLGHLDDRYIEDKLEWLSTKKATERADAVLQRQQEYEQTQAAETHRQHLLTKVDDLATRGSELYDDFQESVVEAGMKGDWRLDQPTFEAAHDAENGAQILYELSQDKKEAARVASLSPYLQLKFVAERDAELGGKAKARKIPGAGAPPTTTSRGANSSTKISPSTNNLDDFEKAWLADEKGHRR